MREPQIQFGKHRGKYFSEIPTPYLRWLAKDDVRDAGIAAMNELESRGEPLEPEKNDNGHYFGCHCATCHRVMGKV